MAKAVRVLTPLERRIMRVLWDEGPGNVQKVVQGLTGEPQLAYTTVQTTLNVLQRKGKVKRKLVGRAFEYSAVVSQEAADSHAVKDVLQKVFRGSVDDLLLTLVRNKHLNARKLAELQAGKPYSVYCSMRSCRSDCLLLSPQLSLHSLGKQKRGISILSTSEC
jgi:predicted transcriptional regulator